MTMYNLTYFAWKESGRNYNIRLNELVDAPFLANMQYFKDNTS